MVGNKQEDATMSGNSTLAKLTPEQKREYLERGGQHCPYCHGTDISGGTLDAEWNEAWAKVTCNGCGRTWQDEYKLVDITEEGED
jgi:transcription elongation factor Elf1